jgi:hypothetical protein
MGTSKSGSCSTQRTETDDGEVQGIVRKRKNPNPKSDSVYHVIFSQIRRRDVHHFINRRRKAKQTDTTPPHTQNSF